MKIDILQKNKKGLKMTEQNIDIGSTNCIIILRLCRIYEDGTGKQILKNNIKDETGVYNFILETLPLLNRIHSDSNDSMEINIPDDDIIKFINYYVSYQQ